MSGENLHIKNGPLAGKSFPIEGVVTIGRNPDNTIQINDLQISRQHASIQKTPVGTILRDLGSGNGTYVGSNRIVEYRLSNGDVIHLGPFEIEYVNKAVEGTPPPMLSIVGRAEGADIQVTSDTEGQMDAASADNIYQTFVGKAKDAASSDELKGAQARLAAVYRANQIISSEQNLDRLFERVMDQIFELVPAHNGVILLKAEKSDELVVEHQLSKSAGAEVQISSSIIARALDNGEAVITYDAAQDQRFEAGASIIAQNIASAMCAPLRHQEETLGVVYVDTRGTANAFDQSDLELLVAVSGPAAIAIRNAQYVQKIQKAYQDTLVALANAVELRDHYTVGHTWRVTNFALEMAKELGWSEEKLEEVEMGGVLHDVGKISIDDSILRKPTGLTDDEYEIMKIHPERGARLMQDIEALVPLIPYCLYHHERYDGKGYPYGLAGEEIPIEGRLLAVADMFDAMTSSRPYRKGLDPEYAIEEVEKGKGTQLDPECAQALITCFRDGRLGHIIQDFGEKSERDIACPFCSNSISVPDNVEVGGEMECEVCHRAIKLIKEDHEYSGELVARADQFGGKTPLPDSGAYLRQPPTEPME
jgi:HD-GYP domain-containing protein (c-di-GMP phosphodiesterase class II)